MSAVGRLRPKICHCRPDCNRLLGFYQRKNHYQLVKDPLTIRRSTTPPGESSEATNEFTADIDIEEQEYEDDADTHMADISQEADEENVDDFDAGQEAGDGFFDGSIEELVDLYSEDVEYDTEGLLSLDEIQEQIEDELGPGRNLEMWQLREP
jgi:hypothetical protein